jgi:D-lactate dehydrogenase (cytochrome)
MALVEATERSKEQRNAAATVIAALAARYGNRLATSQALRQQHGHTTTWIENQPPDAVAFPQSAEEVQEIVRLCAAHRVPVIGFGQGTSLEGQVNAPRGGICLDFRDMNRVLAVHAEDLDCVIEPGITRKQLNEYLRDTGVFFPIDPGADASLGGMAATRASGTNAVRYGTMKDNVLALKAVLANGEMISTGHRAKKSAAGYDLARLMIGSEGTLGIITELTLRLAGIPEAISSGVCPFPSVEAACNATILAIQSGIPVARIEILDAMQVKACNIYSKLTLPETPMLFLELWQARHDAYWAALGLRPGISALSTDVCVPISRLAECVTQSQRDLEENRLMAPLVGHVGDGNFHLLLFVDQTDAEEVKRAHGFLERLAERALAMDGTCTGEHGIGQGKMKYMPAEHGEPTLDVMRAIKRALDPLDIMNPGKIFAM